MRSVWKGHIRFSLVTIPIQVFNAVETKGNISFKQIHKEDNGRVGYKKVCKECEQELGRDDIVKGFEYEPIDIEAFVDISEVHPSRYEAVYYLGPSAKAAIDTFSLFCETLKSTGKAGIGRIILRDREDVVLLTPHENTLIMYKLRYPYEIRSVSDVPDLKEGKIDEAQLKLAKTLVDSLTMSFDEVDFDDRYRDALMDLVDQKIAGKEIVKISEKGEEEPVVDIMAALKKSIEEAKNLKKAG